MISPATTADDPVYTWSADRRRNWVFVFRGVGLTAICSLLVVPIGIAGGPWIPFAVLFSIYLSGLLMGIYIEYASPVKIEFFERSIRVVWQGRSQEHRFSDLALDHPKWLWLTNGGGIAIKIVGEKRPTAIIPKAAREYAEVSKRLSDEIEM